MKLVRFSALALAGTLVCASLIAAPDTNTRARVIRKTARLGKTPAAAPVGFSTEVPVVAFLPANAAADTLILNVAHPFSITLSAKDTGRTGNTGTGLAIPENDIFGFFSIPTITGNSSNPEVFVKVIDGRTFNGFYWIFSNGLSDLEYTLTVREVATGATKVYSKTFGSASACGTFDTSAFASAPSGAEPADKAPLDLEAVTPTTRATTLRSSVDITNTTNKSGVTASIQYSYTCLAAACTPVGGFYSTPEEVITLQALDSRHFDDIVSFFATLVDSSGVPFLKPGAAQGSYGTLLVTFQNLDTNQGEEGTVQARTYSRVTEVDPLKGTVGFATPASIFIEAAKQTLVGTARDTRGGGSDLVGTLSSNVGIRNSDINGTGSLDDVDVTFYDTTTGQRVGGTVTLSGLRPGEVREVNDIWTAAAIPSSMHTVLVFADVRNSTPSSATIEGYITIDDTNSKDTAFVELKCADTACGNPI